MNKEKEPERMPRGLRNNNPLNIRRGNAHWQGLKPVQNDKQFCEFESPAMGFRAAFVLLRRYYVFYGLHTVAQVIRRWAPPSDGNDTKGYVAQVERIAEIHPDYELADPKADPLTWLRIVWAMTCVENGYASRHWSDYVHIVAQMVKGMEFAQITWNQK